MTGHDLKTESFVFELISYLLSSQNDTASESDFQAFEDQAESVIKRCSDSIHALKQSTLRQEHTKQYREHVENLFRLIENYLKGKNKASLCNAKSDLE